MRERNELTADAALTDLPTSSGAERPSRRERELAHLSLNFVLDMAGDGIPGLKSLDALLVMAINQANIGPLTRDPAARTRYGALEAPAPDHERRPVSVRAVAASMQLPYETARRNIRRLEQQGVCVLSPQGVVVPEAFMRSEAYFEAARRGHERLFALYQALRAGGLLEPLPAANYDESEPPIRAAVRLLSDYLLRTAETVVGRTGDLVTGLVLLPLVAAAAGTGDAPAAPLSLAAIARRVHLPAETARRHAAVLTESGLCRSTPRGLVLADAELLQPPWPALLKENAIAVQRMYAGLAERGVVAAWDHLAGADRSQGAA
jgi:hypothetical protein